MVLVRKLDGTLEEFDINKLKASLRKAGASKKAAKEISEHIASEVYDKISTQEIYAHAFEILKHYEKKPVAARYSLKRAIFDLGPSGFPFEQFISQVFKALGYSDIRTNYVVNGQCVDHEIDLFAKKDGKAMGAELKFHNTPGFKTDLKVALYVRSRFEDLKKVGIVDEGWLVTNTIFTDNVKSYIDCAGGLKLLSWDYPEGNALVDIIESAKVHPITALTSLNSGQKKFLISKNIVICKQLLALLQSGELKSLLPSADFKALEEELNLLCG